MTGLRHFCVWALVYALFCFPVAAAAQMQVSEHDEPPSTGSTTYNEPAEDKPSSSDTEATRISES